jgi:hypothetical protein
MTKLMREFTLPPTEDQCTQGDQIGLQLYTTNDPTVVWVAAVNAVANLAANFSQGDIDVAAKLLTDGFIPSVLNAIKLCAVKKPSH